MKVITIILKVLFSIGVMCLLIYGMYYIAKNVSYAIFYEDMVRQTIIEMVKPGYLK